MSEGGDEKLTASQLELGLREARGKEAEERQRIGGGGWMEGGLPPAAEPYFWEGLHLQL